MNNKDTVIYLKLYFINVLIKNYMQFESEEFKGNMFTPKDFELIANKYKYLLKIAEESFDIAKSNCPEEQLLIDCFNKYMFLLEKSININSRLFQKSNNICKYKLLEHMKATKSRENLRKELSLQVEQLNESIQSNNKKMPIINNTTKK